MSFTLGRILIHLISYHINRSYLIISYSLSYLSYLIIFISYHLIEHRKMSLDFCCVALAEVDGSLLHLEWTSLSVFLGFVAFQLPSAFGHRIFHLRFHFISFHFISFHFLSDFHTRSQCLFLLITMRSTAFKAEA